ncbi:hypothetical protein [Amycolatopsis sp.]|uniref:hypothetical protein n=1 Tax=Amycolatopsis sp. TaxID=37632 RepID=UPI002D7EF314|nr:hypothetical protein [Amycolatopsis sp.]HET6705555.1 hypothetical protein [Amycolatopsis sp.]
MTTADDDKELRHRLDTLLWIVQEELAAAGVPLAPGERPVGVAGAVVSVDVPDLRGVLVDWRAHDVLLDAGQEAWGDDPHREGPECAAFTRLLSEIHTAMSAAMRRILTAAGLEVTGSGNDYAPGELLVTRRLAPSVWQARRDARSNRRHESMRMAWNERHAAERRQAADEG